MEKDLSAPNIYHYEHCLDSLQESQRRHLETYEKLQKLTWEETAIRIMAKCITELGAVLSAVTIATGFVGATEISQISLRDNKNFAFNCTSIIMEAINSAWLIITMRLIQKSA